MTERDAKEDAAARRRRINAEAAAWYLRFSNGEADETSPAYRHWLASAAEHAAAMARARSTWAFFGEQAVAPEIVKARRDALVRAEAAAARRWRPVFALPGWFVRRRGALAAALAVLLIAAPAALWRMTAMSPERAEAAATIYTTQIGETRVVTLADNSRVSLDAATRLAVRYAAGARDIELQQGQAHFHVAKDPGRPFRVTARDRTVIATGTAFNVELVGEEVLVTLLEGEVVVTAADAATQVLPPPVRLKPGQQLIASRSAPPEIDDRPNMAKTNAWREGKVFLEGDSLSAAAARMNRYSRIRLVVADAGLDGHRISGVFDAGDTDAFVEAVEAYFPVDARRISAATIALYPRH